MEKPGKKSNRPEENGFHIEAHFGALREEALNEIIDSLASMIYEYVKRGENDE